MLDPACSGGGLAGPIMTRIEIVMGPHTTIVVATEGLRAGFPLPKQVYGDRSVNYIWKPPKTELHA